MKVVATSGYFAPLHRGHIEYLKLARELGDHLVVIINNDKQLFDKNKRIYPLEDRIAVLMELKCVDEVIVSRDEDQTVCKTLEYIEKEMNSCIDIFAKGGDRFESEIPEKAVCDKYGIVIVDGLGKKIQSSTEILKNHDSTKQGDGVFHY